MRCRRFFVRRWWIIWLSIVTWLQSAADFISNNDLLWSKSERCHGFISDRYRHKTADDRRPASEAGSTYVGNWRMGRVHGHLLALHRDVRGAKSAARTTPTGAGGFFIRRNDIITSVGLGCLRCGRIQTYPISIADPCSVSLTLA